MDISIIISILIAWAIIKILEAIWKRHRRNKIIKQYKYSGLTTIRDEDAKLQFEAPVEWGIDSPLHVLWPTMTESERRQWHGVVNANARDEASLEKEQDNLLKMDQSSEAGESRFLFLQERYEANKDVTFKRMKGRIDALVLRVRERLDDEKRVVQYLSNKALVRNDEVIINSTLAQSNKARKYFKSRKHVKTEQGSKPLI